jgi:hypothetical protein
MTPIPAPLRIENNARALHGRAESERVQLSKPREEHSVTSVPHFSPEPVSGSVFVRPEASCTVHFPGRRKTLVLPGFH